MTDIVERLRTSAKDWKLEGEMSGGECVYAFDKLSAELEEAAKEIERLRADNARLRAALQEIVDCAYGLSPDWEKKERVGRIARRALEAKHG